MDLQKIIDAMSAGARQVRSEYHLTLGGLIKLLEVNPDKSVRFENGGSICSPHSYRGYYEDLAFEISPEYLSGKDCLKLLKEKCLYQSFWGYKGGTFTMGEDTPLWRSNYGETGLAIVEAKVIGEVVVLFTKEVD